MKSNELNTEFLKQEYKIALDTYISQVNLAIKVVSGFVVVNTTVIGLAIRSHLSWLFILGALVSFVIIIVSIFGETLTRPFLFRAMELEQKLGEGQRSLAHSWSFFVYGKKGFQKMLEILHEGDTENRITQLRSKIRSKVISSIFVILAIGAVIGQIFLGIYLPGFEGWQFW